jgi:hypothetical protein
MSRPPAFSYPGSKAKMMKAICEFLPQDNIIPPFTETCEGVDKNFKEQTSVFSTIT